MLSGHIRCFTSTTEVNGVAPSGERLQRKGRHGVFASKTVIHVWALWDYACVVNGAIYTLPFLSFKQYLRQAVAKVTMNANKMQTLLTELKR